MKNARFILFFLLMGLSIGSLRAADILHMEPAVWWVGMHETELQILVHGPGIADETPLVKYPGIKMLGVARMSNHDCAIVYLRIAPDTKPGKVTILFGRRKKCKFELRKRMPLSGAEGLSPADVLYRIDQPPAKLKTLQREFASLAAMGVTAVLFPELGAGMEGAVNAAHAAGLKVVVDMDIQHVDPTHWWLSVRPDRDWFKQQSCLTYGEEPDIVPRNLRINADPYAPQTEKDLLLNGWTDASRPSLNHRHYYLAKQLIQQTISWIEQTHIDAIRVPESSFIDPTFLQKWTEAVRNEYPAFSIICGPADIAVDHALPALIPHAIAEECSHMPGREAGLYRIYDALCSDEALPDPLRRLTAAETAAEAAETQLMQPGDPQWKLTQALALLLTTRGIPLLAGTQVHELPELLAWRRTSAAIAQGRLVHYAPDESGCYVYARIADDETVLVVLNGTDRQVALPLYRYREVLTSRKGTDVLSGAEMDLNHPLRVAPRAALVIKLR